MIINVFYAEDSSVNYKSFQRNLAKYFVPALQEKLRENGVTEDITVKVTLSTSGDQAKDTLSKQSTPGFYDIFFMDNEIGAGPIGMEIIDSIKNCGYAKSNTFIAGVSSQLQLGDIKCSDRIALARDLGYRHFLNKQPNNRDITHCDLINGIVGTLKNKHPEMFLSISNPI